MSPSWPQGPSFEQTWIYTIQYMSTARHTCWFQYNIPLPSFVSSCNYYNICIYLTRATATWHNTPIQISVGFIFSRVSSVLSSKCQFITILIEKQYASFTWHKVPSLMVLAQIQFDLRYAYKVFLIADLDLWPWKNNTHLPLIMVIYCTKL